MNTNVSNSTVQINRALDQAIDACRAAGLFAAEGANPKVRQLVSGTGSLALFYLISTPSVVIKIGASHVMKEEIDFFREASAFTENTPSVGFPRVYAHSIEEPVGWFVMEAGQDATVEQTIYDTQGVLKDDWSLALEHLADCLAPLYSSTLTQTVWNLDDYHLAGRSKMLLTENEEFRLNASRLLGRAGAEKILTSEIILNDIVYPAPTALLQKAVSKVRSNKAFSCFIHGDLQLRNIIPSVEQGGFLLIDPRASWEGRAPNLAFRGSPLYDAANILHSIAGLSQILLKKEAGLAGHLVQFESGGSSTVLELSPDFFASSNSAIDATEGIVSRMMPQSILRDDWKPRLYLYAANSCFGWLRSSTVVQDANTWGAIFATGVRMLGRACA